MAVWELDMHQYLSDRRKFRLWNFKNYEIPEELLNSDISPNTPPDLRNALVVERDGKKFVRWIVHPDSSDDSIKTIIKNHTGRDPIVYEHFTGYLGFGRLFAIDPTTGLSFSVKTSTDNIGSVKVRAPEEWRYEWTRAKQARAISDSFEELQAKRIQLKNTVFLKEPMAFGIKDRVRDAMIIGTLGEVASCEKYYLPGFGTLHNKWGKILAGGAEPFSYWQEHFVKPAGRAAAEIFTFAGLQSVRNQVESFYIELDKSKKPTGRIVLRNTEWLNLNNWWPTLPVLKESISKAGNEVKENCAVPKEASEYVCEFKSRFNLKPAVYLHRLIMNRKINGINMTTLRLEEAEKQSTWINREQFSSWAKDYFNAFQDELTNLTGINVPTDSNVNTGLFYNWPSSGFEREFCANDSRDPMVCGYEKLYRFTYPRKTLSAFLECVTTGKESQGKVCPAGLLQRLKK